MNRTIDTIIKELNPIHDFDKITFHNPNNEASELDELRMRCRNALVYYGSLFKPIARGGGIGGVLGAASYFVSGNSPEEGFINGAVILGSLDFTQYAWRILSRYAKANNLLK